MLGIVSYALFAIIMLSLIAGTIVLASGLFIRFKKK